MLEARLRPLAVRDLSGVEDLHARCFPDEPWAASDFASLLDVPGTMGWCLWSANPWKDGDVALLGFLLARLLGEEAEVLTFCVAPEYRRQGKGACLLGEAVSLLRGLGAKRLLLEVAEDNGPGLALYASLGFQETSRRPAYYRRRNAQPVDALLLARALA